VVLIQYCIGLEGSIIRGVRCINLWLTVIGSSFLEANRACPHYMGDKLRLLGPRESLSPRGATEIG